MRSGLIPGGAVLMAAAGAAFLAKRRMSTDGGIDFEQMIERMPENAPPRWVFSNVTAIRKNTERILELLEAKPTPPGTSEPPGETSAAPPTPPA